MNAPRIEFDLDRIGHNAHVLVTRVAALGVGVTGVTKAVLGLPVVATALLNAGVATLGDSRIDNVERLRRGGIEAPIVLVRSPMASQVDRVVAAATTSCNTEIEVMESLATAARRRGVVHGVLIMVELGDLREGVLPAALHDTVAAVLHLQGLALRGIGTNLACRSGVVPDQSNMDELSLLARNVESDFGVELPVVSGGNSANLGWLLGGGDPGRINDLRLGESVLLGREPLHRHAIDGLYTNAFTVIAEVIESTRKPVLPRGRIAQAAFGAVATPAGDESGVTQWQSILAIGHQDVDPTGLALPTGMRVLGASSDHLVVASSDRLAVGSEVEMTPDYSALLRAMTSPFVSRRLVSRGSCSAPPAPSWCR